MADAKITELVAGTLSSDDLLTFVDDPSGTPVNKKIAYSSFLAGLSITESQISDLGTYLSTADIDTLAELNAIVADDTIIGAAATDASSFGFVVDEDNLASNLDTKVPTQQSVKAYVDSVVAGLTALEAADIDTLAEINAILGDATLVTVEATDASGYGWVIDEDDMTSDSATKVPTQQSVKAYVDAEIAGVGGGSTLPVTDTTGIAKGSADATKIVRLEVDGLTTGTTRVLTVQDSDGTIALAGDNIAASQVTSGTLAHERGGLEADVSAYNGVPLISGGSTSELKYNLTATTDPGVGDDSDDGYTIGSRWVNVTLDKEFVCLDASVGAAVWGETTVGADTGSGAAGGYGGLKSTTNTSLTSTYANLNFATAMEVSGSVSVSTSTNRVTVSADGNYRVTVSVSLVNNSTTAIRIATIGLHVNGSLVEATVASVDYNADGSGQTPYRMAILDRILNLTADDYIEIKLKDTSNSGELNLTDGAMSSLLVVQL